PVVPLAQSTVHAVPFRMAPWVGCVMNTLKRSFAGDVAAAAVASTTHTWIEVLPMRPVASRTQAVSVFVPLVVAVHGIWTGPREEVFTPPTNLPLATRLNELAEPLVPSTHSVTAVPRLTSAPTFGAVIATLIVPDGGGGGGGGVVVTTPLAPWTLTWVVVEPVRPVASRTEAVSVVLPLTAGVHGITTGPREDVVRVPTTFPAALSVKTFEEPLVPSTHSTTDAVPRTMAPASGCVMATASAPGGGGGGGDEVPPVAEPLRARDSVSPAALKLTLVAKVPAPVGWNRTTTVAVAFAASENGLPETIRYGDPTLALPDRDAPLVFCTVKD